MVIMLTVSREQEQRAIFFMRAPDKFRVVLLSTWLHSIRMAKPVSTYRYNFTNQPARSGLRDG
jgi:hypothetical protein